MTKIIIVSGQGNTGKTSAIRRTISLCCKGLWKATGDITLIAPVRKKGVVHHIGFASGGDTKAIVQSNIDFFEKHKWDCLIFASKSRGATLALLNKFAAAKGIHPIYIATIRQPPHSTNAYCDAIARQITVNIP